MALPKLDVPLFTMAWPSKQKEVTFRPFLVKEEKILLMAQQGGTDKEITLALKQILNNCIQDKDFNADELTTFDLEYMFIKLRSKSVSNEVKLTYEDLEDQKNYDFTIDLDTIELIFNPDHTNKIVVDEHGGIIMKYPTVDSVAGIPEDSTYVEVISLLIERCIDKVYNDDEVIIFNEESEEDRKQFLDMLPVSVYQKMKDFFETLPTLEYRIKYKNSLNHDREIVLRNLKDFFTWG